MAGQTNYREGQKRSQASDGDGMARTLGWISLALGVSEIVAAPQLDRLLGTGDGEHAGIFRVLGIRELCHGIDLLTHDDPTPGIWARVAGDLLDSAVLAVAAAKSSRPTAVAAATALVLPVVAADIAAAVGLPPELPGVATLGLNA